MKRSCIILLLALLTLAGNAQVKAKRIKPYLSTTTYDAPGMTPYV